MLAGGEIPEQESEEGSQGVELRHSQGRPITVRENREWKPAVAYCRYADDFVVIVKGTKAHAEVIREECRAFLFRLAPGRSLVRFECPLCHCWLGSLLNLWRKHLRTALLRRADGDVARLKLT